MDNKSSKKETKSVEILNLPSRATSASDKKQVNQSSSDGALRAPPDPDTNDNDEQTFSPKNCNRNNLLSSKSDAITENSAAKYLRNSTTMSSDHHKHRNRSMSLQHKTCDVFMCLVIIFPLTIGFWRGIWQLMDSYSIGYGGAWLSLILGNGFQMGLYFFQEPFKSYIQPSRMNCLTFYIATRSLLMLHSFSSVNQWRGLWVILDDGTEPGSEVASALMTLVIGVVISFVLKVFTNVLAPPTLAIVDEAHTIHDYPLRFESKWHNESRWMYLCDCFFSVFVVQSLVIFCWRGLWNLADEFLYPNDKMTSALISLAVGYSLTILLCALYPLYFRIITRCKRGFLQLVIFDVFSLCGFVACVLAWRGLWEIYNLVIVFETPLLSEWVTTIVGILGCALFGCVSSIAARGVTMDGDLDTTPEWPLSYFTLLYEKPPEAIPFPEPWVFRYFLTQQPMCSTTEKNVRKSSLSPLNAKPVNNKSKSASDQKQKHGNVLQNPNAHAHEKQKPLAYPGLRNIDSSCDEEEMEMMAHHKS